MGELMYASIGVREINWMGGWVSEWEYAILLFLHFLVRLDKKRIVLVFGLIQLTHRICLPEGGGASYRSVLSFSPPTLSRVKSEFPPILDQWKKEKWIIGLTELPSLPRNFVHSFLNF